VATADASQKFEYYINRKEAMPEQYSEPRLCNGWASFRLSVPIWAPSNNSAGASPAYAGSTTLPEYVAANQGLISDKCKKLNSLNMVLEARSHV